MPRFANLIFLNGRGSHLPTTPHRFVPTKPYKILPTTLHVKVMYDILSFQTCNRISFVEITYVTRGRCFVDTRNSSNPVKNVICQIRRKLKHIDGVVLL